MSVLVFEHGFGHLPQFLFGYPPVAIGDLLQTGDLDPLPLLEHLDEDRRLRERVVRTYSQRLKRLTENVKVDGLELNFKVYEVADVNAFACGDGSVRVFSSLMDLMDDRQLMGVIGHEIGHVVHADTKDAMKNAYMASAARNAAGSAGGTLAKLTDSQLGDLVQAFSNAQFSQKQESAADDFGFDFCVQNGLDPYSMASALEKLAELSQGSQSSGLQRMFSSHPDSQKRAERMRARAEELIRQQQQ